MAGRKKPSGRGGSSASRKKPASTPSPLSNRYEFTPNSPPLALELTKKNPPSVRDYPPPARLFQSTLTQPPHTPPGTSTGTQPRPTPALSEPRLTPAVNPRSAQLSLPQPRSAPEPQPRFAPEPSRRRGSNSRPRSSQHSQAGNLQSDGDEEIGAEVVQANLWEQQEALLMVLLNQPGREEYTTVLSPTVKPNTTWFGRDKLALTRKITKIFTNKFSGPYYSWSCVPRERQERYLVEFAKTHHWDPLLTGVVQQHFESICQKRMKDMVSTARTSGVQPKWITYTIWTEEAKEKSQTTSDARMSDPGGLGPHVHLSGQKSYLQIKQEMEEEFGRPLSLGEVFIKVHTKPDGTFVDQKAQDVAKRFQENLESKKMDIEDDASETSDGTSRTRDLTIDEKNEIFLQSTYANEKGSLYGLGSLAETHVNGKKRKYPGSSASFDSIQQQLEEAKRQIEVQAT